MAGEGLPETVDFNFHVKPILSDRCFKCHGPDDNTRVEEIRFDTQEGIRRSRGRIRGKILAEDPGERMPPPESNLTLSALEKATLLRWVEDGAPYESHWAFSPPSRPDLPTPIRAQAASLGPAGTGSAWGAGSVDTFVLEAMTREGFDPAPMADDETWLRRVSFVLTGLPPTLERMDAFAADGDRGRVIEDLLDSPVYGERMAVDWLDLARYADSHGYQDDGWRNMWPWRDWVISAFNRNMPYDEFVTWQLAGDLLPTPTSEQILATGFNRNHLQSQEGGIVLEEYRVDYVANRTDTFGKAFLGLTMECARCHDHKYDPVTQEDYYGLFAFFNSVNEVGNIPYAGEASPTVLLVDSLSQQRLDALQTEIRRLEALVRPEHVGFDEEFSEWASSGHSTPLEPVGEIAHFPLDGFEEVDELFRLEDRANPAETAYFWGDLDKLPTRTNGVVDSALVLRGDGWLDTGNQRFRFERSDPFSLDLHVRLESERGVGPLMGKSGGLFNGNRGYIVTVNPERTLTAGLFHVAPDDGIEVVTTNSLSVGVWHRVTLTYDGSSRARGLRLYLDGLPMATETRVDNLKQSILYTVDPFSGDSTNWGDPGNLRVGFVETNQPLLSEAAVDEFRVYDRALTAAEISGHPPQPEDLRAYYVTITSPRYRRLSEALHAARSEENRILTHTPSVMVMRDRRTPAETFVLERGAYDNPGQPVTHSTPKSILDFADRPANRLGLANWLFDAGNPLTARVAVNRLWQQVFGAGLVSTADNFGSQGALPSHPELLDWLAVEFRESGWDVQHMLRLMVSSSTFAQSSIVDPSRDPDNRWLARGPSGRLSAEMVRDQALSASGLLVGTIGGPPVKPYQPSGLWAALATRNGVKYQPDSGDALHRRSMYTLWKRTTPPPMMLTFDASERNLCTIQRQTTSTPLQALVLMNDPQFVEAARVLGERMIREGGPDSADRIAIGFRLLTGRSPKTGEYEELGRLAENQEALFAQNRQSAALLLSVGDSPRDPSLDPAQAAAYTVVASTIMNFDAATILR